MILPHELILDAVPFRADGRTLIAPHVILKWHQDDPPRIDIIGVHGLEKAAEIELRLPGTKTDIDLLVELCPPPLPNRPWLTLPHHHGTLSNPTADTIVALEEIRRSHADDLSQ